MESPCPPEGGQGRWVDDAITRKGAVVVGSDGMNQHSGRSSFGWSVFSSSIFSRSIFNSSIFRSPMLKLSALCQTSNPVVAKVQP